MPYADPDKRRQSRREWIESQGGDAAYMRIRRARREAQREVVRAKDRERKRAKRADG